MNTFAASDEELRCHLSILAVMIQRDPADLWARRKRSEIELTLAARFDVLCLLPGETVFSGARW